MESSDAIKSIIEDKLCPIHDLHPVVDTAGNELHITCCCTNFHTECTEEIEGLFMLNPVFPYWVIA
jgi:hypothetical protein